MVSVLLAEDHKIVRQGTRLFLENAGLEVVGEAVNGREALEMARSLRPDVVVMDIHMPELTGVEATRRIRDELDDVRVLVLTAYDDPPYVRALLEAGADGFILKTAAMNELVQAIHDVAAGKQAFDTDLISQATNENTTLPAQVEGLTNRELEVLRQAASGKTNKQIGDVLFISARTVQGHLQNIYQKLGVSSRTQAVTTALKHGLLPDDSENPPS
jgi:DNA-binding NarL/FixJ family response regulator